MAKVLARMKEESRKALHESAAEIVEQSKGDGRPDRPTVERFAAVNKGPLADAIEESQARGDLDRELAADLLLKVNDLAKVRDLRKVDSPGQASYWGAMVGGVVLLIDVSLTGGAITLHKIAWEHGAILVAAGVGGGGAITGVGAGYGERQKQLENQTRLVQRDEVVEAARIVLKAHERALESIRIRQQLLDLGPSYDTNRFGAQYFKKRNRPDFSK